MAEDDEHATDTSRFFPVVVDEIQAACEEHFALDKNEGAYLFAGILLQRHSCGALCFFSFTLEFLHERYSVHNLPRLSLTPLFIRTEWTPIVAADAVMAAIARTTNRVIVGQPMCMLCALIPRNLQN